MSSPDKEVRIGIVGMGNMGRSHAGLLREGKVKGACLGAVSDVCAPSMESFPDVPQFRDPDQILRSGKVDAVLIATPHFSHTEIGIAALKQGLHVLVEKPIGVHKNDCAKLIAAYKPGSGQVFSAMFNQRTDPYYQKIRDLVQGGELGAVRRVNWIITNWFRPDAYYSSSEWRATWRGEGGGVLLNQCPHNLDLLQWIFGMPKSVRAFCRFGQYHKIEVEDDVTAYMEFPNGATGVFITTTGEAPGTNRLEVTTERGKLIYENDRLAFTRNEVETGKFSRTTTACFAAPPTWDITIPVSGHGTQHLGILQNFTDAILSGAPLLAPGGEGIRSVELANAMLYSTFTEKTIAFPLDGNAYERQLKKLIAQSKPAKKKRVAAKTSAGDFSKSFK
jgi:predicted dehydrogenase